MPAITLIDSIPSFVSQEEYSSIVASTPSSFNDLPAVLKLKEENVSVSIRPPVQGFDDEDATKGTLYVLTSVLVYASSTGRIFQVEYPSITLHAVSRGNARPSVYCQLDETQDPENQLSTLANANTGTGGDEEEAINQEEFTDMKELDIIPFSDACLNDIFEALSQCAALHPDKLSDDEDMDGAIMHDGSSPFEVFTGDADEEFSEVGKVRSDFVNNNRFTPY